MSPRALPQERPRQPRAGGGRGPVAALLALLLVGACSATGGHATSSPIFPVQPSPSAPGASVPGRPSPTGAISVGEAIARQVELDGRRVTVEAGYWSDGSVQLLSDVLLESYPPQVPRDASLILKGKVPATILGQLEHAAPGNADVTWGQVVVTGVLHAGSERVPPILDLETIGLS
ncbi:MAG: hypothetical protein ACXWPO_04290 [Candidatus Limnocylindrales bacterium]